MRTDRLTMPIREFMRPVASVHPDDPLRIAAEALRECGVAPVTASGRLLGVVTEAGLASALANGASSEDPAASAMATIDATLAPEASGAEALRALETSGRPVLVIEGSLPCGVVAASDLLARAVAPVRPPAVGGMATPFGVYLTTGGVSAGAGHLALVATGALLFSLAAVSAVVADSISVAAGLHRSAVAWEDLISLALFALGMRLLPLTGTHAAEHMVVHAIEQGRELSARSVRRMPRVHPRCGTNVAVGLSLFLALGSARFVPVKELQLVIALAATLILWRPLGGIVQLLVTTKPPNDRQVASGIAAGTELLERYMAAPYSASALIRIWNAGILQVIAGASIAYAALTYGFALAGIHLAV